MTDIVDRFRRFSGAPVTPNIATEAADEITRLRTSNAELVAALEAAFKSEKLNVPEQRMARAAIEKAHALAPPEQKERQE